MQNMNTLIMIFLSVLLRSIMIDSFTCPTSSFIRRQNILFRQISNYPLRDGRRVRIHNSDFSSELCLRVQRVARASIRKKNSFSFCLTGGDIPNYLKGLTTTKHPNYHKWHIFVAEENIGIHLTLFVKNIGI